MINNYVLLGAKDTWISPLSQVKMTNFQGKTHIGKDEISKMPFFVILFLKIA